MKGMSKQSYITPFRESETSQYKSVGGVAQSRTYKQYNATGTVGNIFNPPPRTLTKFNALPEQTNNATEPQVLMIQQLTKGSAESISGASGGQIKSNLQSRKLGRTQNVSSSNPPQAQIPI